MCDGFRHLIIITEHIWVCSFDYSTTGLFLQEFYSTMRGNQQVISTKLGVFCSVAKLKTLSSKF